MLQPSDRLCRRGPRHASDLQVVPPPHVGTPPRRKESAPAGPGSTFAVEFGRTHIPPGSHTPLVVRSGTRRGGTGMAARPSLVFVLAGALASLGAQFRTQNFLVE